MSLFIAIRNTYYNNIKNKHLKTTQTVANESMCVHMNNLTKSLLMY